jgi:hypothetical protein
VKPNKPLTDYNNRVAQFQKEEQLKIDAEMLRQKAGVSKQVKALDTQNPYLRARIEILTKYPEWRRKEVQEMERTGDINNKFYLDFVHDVAVLGDTFMPL